MPPSPSAKQRAGEYAAQLARDGMLLGLGTGSTAACAVRAIGQRVRTENLRVAGICTSRDTEELAREEGIPIQEPWPGQPVDLYIDGADEVDSSGILIKGGGGAHFREKLVALNSRYRVIIVDESKVVELLGVAFPLPVEVAAWGHGITAESIRTRTGAQPVLRVDGEGNHLSSVNGGVLYDCVFPKGIPNPEAIATALDGITGVLEHGLFIGLADLIVVGNEAGVRTVKITEASLDAEEA